MNFHGCNENYWLKIKKKEIIPKKEEPGINETNLSEQLTKLFPKIDQIIDEKSNDQKKMKQKLKI